VQVPARDWNDHTNTLLQSTRVRGSQALHVIVHLNPHLPEMSWEKGQRHGPKTWGRNFTTRKAKKSVQLLGCLKGSNGGGLGGEEAKMMSSKGLKQVHDYTLAHDNSSIDPVTLSMGVRAYKHTHTHRRHTHTHTHAHTHAHTQTHALTHIHTHTRTHTHTQTHIHTHTHTHTRTHTHTHINAHTFTHIHTCVSARQRMCFFYIPAKNGVTPKLPSEVAQCL